MGAMRSAVGVTAAMTLVVFGSAAFAQAATSAALSGPVPTDGLTAVVWAMLMSWLMQVWKETPWLPGITESATRKAQRLFAAFVAAASAFGISVTYDGALGRLTLDGLQLASIAGAVWEFVKQFVLQEFAYRAGFKPRDGTPMTVFTNTGGA